LPKQIPVPSEANKPFWDALNQRKLMLQHCKTCDRLIYPIRGVCDKCRSSENLDWKEVEGKGHILEYYVIRDTRIRRLMEDQPLNFALITLDEDPGINFLSNLPGTPVGEVPVGAPVEVFYEQVVGADQLIHEWKVVGQ
jgi:uncharacterized OB-fold protein